MNQKNIMRVAFPVAVALCVASLKWQQVQGVATILLLLVTLKYVLLTQENIELFRRQLQRQEKVYLDFDLVCRNHDLFLRVANLGISNFLVSAVRVRTQDIREFDYSTHEIVESGKSAEISVPGEVCVNQPFAVGLEIAIEYVGLDVREKSDPKYFEVSMSLRANIPDGVKKRMGGIWSVACPRCGTSMSGFLAMSLRGLNTFDEAIARKKLLLEDLNSSCPNHESKLLMTIEDAQDAL
jgi:hypothetical protein